MSINGSKDVVSSMGCSDINHNNNAGVTEDVS